MAQPLVKGWVNCFNRYMSETTYTVNYLDKSGNPVTDTYVFADLHILHNLYTVLSVSS